MMNLETVREIGQVLENSWGRESSPDGTFSIKYAMDQDQLTLKFTTVVHFAEQSTLAPQVNAANDQAIQLIDAKIGKLKNEYRESLGATLQLEDLGGQDNLEIIMPVGPRKVAYYRYNHVFKVQ